MSEKYKFRDPEGVYFVTCTIVHWIDLFTGKELKHILIRSLDYCQHKKGLVIHAWVIMPSHIHLILSSGFKPLNAIIRDFKKYTSRELVKELKRLNESRKVWLLRAFEKSAASTNRVKHNKVWQDGNHPILLDNAKLMDDKLAYIHMNPVEAEIVDEPAYYWYSSARDYAGGKGLLKLSLIE